MTAPALAIEGLEKSYRGGRRGVAGIDLTIDAGEFFGLLGENGAGKTTTIGIVSSLVRADAGRVRVFGHDLVAAPEAAKRLIGLVPQEPNFNGYEPVAEIVLTQAAYYGLRPAEARRRAQHYLEALGLWDRRDQLARRLSGGFKRRLMIARALVHQPRLLLLDEPTAGVDITLRRQMWDFLSQLNAEGTTIVLTTHYLEEAEALCRRLGIIDQGRMLALGRTAELLHQLQTETFIFDLQAPCSAPPCIAGATTRLVGPETLEIEVERGRPLNDLFAALSTHGIQVVSLRNKANRLEELFVRLVGNDAGRRAAATGPPT